VYTKDFWFRTSAAKRAPSSETAGSGFAINNTPSYFADVWGTHMDVSDQIRANSDDPLNSDRDATLYVTQQLLLRREIQFMQNYMQTGIWQGYIVGGSPIDFTPSNLWDTALGNPLQDIDNLKSFIKSQTGFLPNTLAVSNDVFFVLRNNPFILDRIKYTQRGLISEDLLASVFGVDKFLVAGAVQNTAQEGAPGVYSFLTSKSFLLTYANPAPSILQPSAGYIFSWKGLFGAGAQGNRIKTFRMEHLESDRIEGEMAFAMQTIGLDLGVFGSNVISV
jgi:hypothetical protein